MGLFFFYNLAQIRFIMNSFLMAIFIIYLTQNQTNPSKEE